MKISTVDFIFDFASPNAYLCHKVIPSIEAKTGVTFNYIHCLLGGIFKITNNQAPMISFANIQNKLEYESLEMQRFIDKYALSKFTMNSNFPITTVTLQRGGLVAEEQGCGAAYRDLMLKGMWEEDANLGDLEVFSDYVKQLGLNPEQTLEKLSSPAIKQLLIDNTSMAVERGAFGVPTFYAGSEMFFGKERLSQLEEFLLTQN
jgi:2-hydroxychromene-2-carboxylate isomerase